MKAFWSNIEGGSNIGSRLFSCRHFLSSRFVPLPIVLRTTDGRPSQTSLPAHDARIRVRWSPQTNGLLNHLARNCQQCSARGLKLALNTPTDDAIEFIPASNREDRMAELERLFAICQESVRIANLEIDFWRPSDLDKILNEATLLEDLATMAWYPYWAQAWDSGWAWLNA